MVQALIDAGASLKLGPTEYGNTPLTSAIFNGNVEVVKVLIDAGASLEAGPTDYFITPLQSAIFTENVDVVKALADAGASLELEPTGSTPLYSAIHQGNVEVIQTLIDAGASLDSRRFGDTTSLHFAMYDYQGNVNVIKVVLLASLTARPLKSAFLLTMWLTALNSSLANGSLDPIFQAYLLNVFIVWGVRS